MAKEALRTEPMDVPEDWQKLPFHPLANLAVFGQGINLNDLAAHMREHGYDPDEFITLIKSPVGGLQILEGRHRIDAARRAGVVPTFRLFVGTNPKAYVGKKDLRQHLPLKSRTLIAEATRNQPAPETDVGEPEIGGKSAQKRNAPDPKASADAFSKKPKKPSQKQAAAVAGISRESLQRTEKVRQKGIPQLYWALQNTESMSISEAARIADLSNEQQKEALKPYFCDRCWRTGAMQDGCERCAEARKKKPKLPKAPPPARGEPKFNVATWREHIGKALNEANKLARQHGFLTIEKTIDEPPPLREIRCKLQEVSTMMKAWLVELGEKTQ